MFCSSILRYITLINIKVVKNKINLTKIRPVSFIDIGFILGGIRKYIWNYSELRKMKVSEIALSAEKYI